MVYSASDGEEGYEKIKEFVKEIDLMITDIIMPRMNGRELIRKVKSKYKNMKIICTSGYTDGYLRDKNELTEDVKFLPKPFSFESLIKTISELFS